MNDLLTLIKDRHSSRVLFDPKHPVAKDDLHKILEAGSWAPTAHNMQNFEVVIVDDKKIIEDISKIKAPVSLTFVKENYKQFSFTEEELGQKKTGVLATTFPPAWRKPHVTKADLSEDGRNTFMEEELSSTPVLGIVLYDESRRAPASEGDFLGKISLGCVMENMWLMANSLGIDFHIVSSLSNGPIEKGIKKMLGIPEELVIAYSFRLGYPVSTYKYLRVRRDVEDFTHHNKYGVKGI
ncbi:MAG: nitroreductase family protein [Bacteroidia bacterium]